MRCNQKPARTSNDELERKMGEVRFRSPYRGISPIAWLFRRSRFFFPPENSVMYTVYTLRDASDGLGSGRSCPLETGEEGIR